MIKTIIENISLWLIPAMILIVLVIGICKKLPVYELFVEGAKDGAKIGVNIFPYIMAIVVAISMIRASGAIEYLGVCLSNFLNIIHVPVDVLPIMILRSLSGSAILGVLSDIAASCDINSYTTKLAAIMAGSSETTLYVIAVYFGAVGIKKYRYALLTGILADIAGIVAAIGITYWFFG